MNRDRMLLGMGVALVIAFLAASYVYRQMKQGQQDATAVKQTQVVVAAGPLVLGQRLTADDVKTVSWPENMQPKGAFTRKEDCIGRAVIVPLVSNEVILDDELAKPEAGSGLPVTIPDGMRAVSVGVDDVVAVAGFVTPGTMVDVLVTGNGPAGSITRTILEHVRVLTVGQQVQQVQQEPGKPQSPQVAPVVTLLVSPEDAQKLTLAASDGRIHLSLRNTLDAAIANPAPIYGNVIFTGGPPPAAQTHKAVAKAAPKPVAPPPPPPWSLQVIRGDRVDTQSFPR